MQPGNSRIGSFIATGILVLVVTGALMADQVIIKGTVTHDFQIVDAAGQSYDVAESDAADAMMSRATGRKVEVTGTLRESAGIRTITVKAFTVIDK